VVAKVHGKNPQFVENVEKDFEEFLREKYSFKGSVPKCPYGVLSVADAKAREDDARAGFKSQNKKIVDTGWKPDNKAAATQ